MHQRRTAFSDMIFLDEGVEGAENQGKLSAKSENNVLPQKNM
jgi:hypothetical protein